MIALGDWRKDGTESQVVGSRLLCGGHLGSRVSRNPDQFSGSHDCAGHPDRQVLLAEMDAVGVHRQSQIAPVVDQKARAGIPRGLAQGDGLAVGRQHGGRFIAVLKEPRAAVGGVLENIKERPSLRSFGIENDVEPVERR